MTSKSCTSTAYEGCQTPFMCQHWCGKNLRWTYSLNYCTSSSFVALRVTQKSWWLPKAWSTRVAVMLLGHTHMHLHSIWRLSNTLNVFGIDKGRILIWSVASITALQHHLLPGTNSGIRCCYFVKLKHLHCPHHWLITWWSCQSISDQKLIASKVAISSFIAFHYSLAKLPLVASL